MSDSQEFIFNSNPKYTGPGLWFWLHLRSYWAITEKTINSFISDLKLLADNHPCGNCRQHMQEYLTTHPIENNYSLVDENNRPIGMFDYIFNFHNAVNSRLSKPLFPYDTALAMYSELQDTALCNTSCGSEVGNNSEIGSIMNSDEEYGNNYASSDGEYEFTSLPTHVTTANN